MKSLIAVVISATLFVSACSKNEVRSCNPKTLLINFLCGDDLSADGVDLQVKRGDGETVSLVSKLKCPGNHTYEIRMANYAEGQRFDLTATPTKESVPAAKASVMADVRLDPTCTVKDFPVTAMGGVTDNVVPDGGMTPEAGTTTCIPGDRGCGCVEGVCNDGLLCLESICASAICGNGIVNSGEDCDQGALNDDAAYGGCKTNCTFGPRCGDGIKQGAEQCEDLIRRTRSNIARIKVGAGACRL